MKSRFGNLSFFIFILMFIGMLAWVLPSFSQEEGIEVPPRELIEEMLQDENLPDEIKEELRNMLESGEVDAGVEIPEPAEKVIREDVSRTRRPRSSSSTKVTPREQPKPQPSQAPSNTISLDLKGVDIIDVLKMLSARSNLNIVAGRNVRGRVTLFLKDVDIWDAFEIILAANSLAYEKEGDIINVMTERDYEQLYGEKFYTKKELRIFKLEYAKAIDVSKALNQAKSKIGKVIIDEGSNTVIVMDSPRMINNMEQMIARLDEPVETRVFSLNYAKAEDIKTKISEALTKGVGTIQVDERTNKVIVKELSKQMPEIAKIIEEMDEKHKVVLIEAKIVEIELTEQYQYGIDWKAVFNKHPATDGIRLNFDNIGGSVFDGAATGGAFTVAEIAHGYFENAIEVLETVGKTNVISCPRITVLNNEEARVMVGTKQPYVTTTRSSTEVGTDFSSSVTYIDLGISLTVTPTINRDGFVTMKIKPEIKSQTGTVTTAHEEDATGDTIPVVSTSESETTVMVKDGHTIIIAGLIQDRDEFEENKIPILGDIPLLGYFFKNKTRGEISSTDLPEKKELVVFLTPYIVHGTETFPEIENIWYRDAVSQNELLESELSSSMEVPERMREVLKKEEEMPKQKEKVDKTTRIRDDIDWWSDLDEITEGMKHSMKEKMQLKVEDAKEKIAEADEKGEEKPLMIPTNLIPPTTGGYYNYYEALRNRIYWIAKDSCPAGLNGKSEDVKVAFTVSNDGYLKGDPEVLNIVDEVMASAAVNAVMQAAPFPPFPANMDKGAQMFKIIITYR